MMQEHRVLRAFILILIVITINSWAIASPTKKAEPSSSSDESEDPVPTIKAAISEQSAFDNVHRTLSEVSRILSLSKCHEFKSASESKEKSKDHAQAEFCVDPNCEAGSSYTESDSKIPQDPMIKSETPDSKQNNWNFMFLHYYESEKERLMKYHQDLAFLLYAFNPQSPHAFRILCDKLIVPPDQSHVCYSSFNDMVIFEERCKEIFEMEKEAFRLKGKVTQHKF